MSSHLHWRKQLLAEARRIDSKLLSELRDIVGAEQVRADEPMHKHTTYRIGGPADVFVVVPDETALLQVQTLLAEQNTDVTVFGGGSNVLVQDGGIRGVVLKLGKGFETLDVESSDAGVDTVRIGAATSIGRLIKSARERGWAALAPVAGTPGTIGGALRMNAGSRDVWLGNFVTSVDVVHRGGRQQTIQKDKLEYGYRSSKIPVGSVITGGTLQFESGDPDQAREQIDAHIQKRKATQPLSTPNGGSVFRNPEGHYAAELIERAGLKGVRLHDAQISDRHANFIVNLGSAHARDVVALIKMIKQKVYEETGLKLEEELRVIGEPGEFDDE